MEDEPPFVHSTQGDRSSLQVIVRHDLGDRTLVVVLLLAAIIGCCGVVIGMDLSERRSNNDRLASSEKESRMLEYYVNEVDGKLIHAGFIEPRDRWSPEKRKQYEEKHP